MYLTYTSQCNRGNSFIKLYLYSNLRVYCNHIKEELVEDNLGISMVNSVGYLVSQNMTFNVI